MSDHSTGDIHNQVVEDHHHESSTKSIWITFWILLAITVFEVGIAFTSIPMDILRWVFIILTIVKAYFIVAHFMHLKHEHKFFRYMLILPFMFIVYLICISLGEGVAIKNLTDFIPKF